MKNIHILPTDKPSRLAFIHDKLYFDKEEEHITSSSQNICITNDEEIKEGDWVVEINTSPRTPYIGKTFYPKNDGTVTEEDLKKYLLSVNYKDHYETTAHKGTCSKIILTTDTDLIKDGVQAIDDEFLEWFVKNPSCERVEVNNLYSYTNESTEHIGYKLIIPKEESKDFKIPNPMNNIRGKIENLRQRAIDFAGDRSRGAGHGYPSFEAKLLEKGYCQGAKDQKKIMSDMFSKEEVLEHLNRLVMMPSSELDKFTDEEEMVTMKWFEQFKKK